MEMVYLAITREGLRKVLSSAVETGAIVWCGADAMTDQEFDEYLGANLSRFICELESASDEDLAGAVDTVRDHHPTATIWIESRV